MTVTESDLDPQGPNNARFNNCATWAEHAGM